MIESLSCSGPTKSRRKRGQNNLCRFLSFHSWFSHCFWFSTGSSTTGGSSTTFAFAARFGLGFVSNAGVDVSGSIAVSTSTIVSVLSRAFGFDTLFALALGLGGSGSPTSSVLVSSFFSFLLYHFQLPLR